MKTQLLPILLWLLLTVSRAAPVPAAEPELRDESQWITLFACDDSAIPFTQNLRLRPVKPLRHPANPVLQRGKPGTPDSWAVQFYGSVIREGDRLRMWYVAAGDDRLDPRTSRSAPWRVAYAESIDGVTWTKPQLGLVEYQGNRNNNLVALEPRLGVVNVKVLRDSDDPDPARRYKMGAHVWFPKNKVRLGTLAPYASADGLNWKLLIDAEPRDAELHPADLVIPALHFEPVGGLYKWNGVFYASGQNAIPASRPYHGRVVRHFMSPDFVHWTQSSAIAYVREPQHRLLGPGRSREGEQTHEGISVWNRGNVLIGLSGIWHGGKEWSDVTIDLGLVLSNDGLRFRAPFHEEAFLERGEDGAWDQGGLLQGQGFENIGDKTFIYYGAWDPRHWQGSPPRGGVGIAVLPRDRFAELVVDESTQGKGDYQLPKTTCEFMTSAIALPRAARHRILVNAAGLSSDAFLQVELLSKEGIPLPGRSRADAAIVTASGFQTPVEWKNEAGTLPDSIRLRVTFAGPNRNQIRLSALYVAAE